jgi:putative flippase GtrA
MLIACKHLGYPIREVPIRTIYVDGNRSSHFDPVRDSMRIYFVLLRFSFVSLATALLDNVMFFAAFGLTGVVWQSQAAGRLVALLFNYWMARRAVFLTRLPHGATLPRYLALVVASGVTSYLLLTSLVAQFGMPVAQAKILAESLLFLANFAIQRDFVFVRRAGTSPTATDWDAYYQGVPATARLTRKYTAKTLVAAMRRFACAEPRILELGGANSSFLDVVLDRIRPQAYRIVDANRYGLDLLQARARDDSRVEATEMDVRHLAPGVLPESDVVFSVGLVEHFDPSGTREAVAAHFATLAPGGCAIISFPTPTWLYRAARSALEAVGLWKFPDERPLRRDEVVGVVEAYGELVFEKTLWPLVLTQHLVVVRKVDRASPA